MPLPFILAGAAIAAAGFGAKKAYDGYQDSSEADEIVKRSERRYESAKDEHEHLNQMTNDCLARLGNLQLLVGTDFVEFHKIAQALLDKIGQSNNIDIKLSIPQHKLDSIQKFSMSATTYMAQVAGAGLAGAAAAYATYGGVMAFAAASTGTSIASLSGVAAYNATMAAIGGGSLAAGGMGMAGGAAILGGVVAAPVLLVAGWAYASHAEKKLEDAQKIRRETNQAIDKFERAESHLGRVIDYVNKIHAETNRLYQIFMNKYFSILKLEHDIMLAQGDNYVANNKDYIIEKIDNGYIMAAILTDIITTPLFKPELDSMGRVVMDENDAVSIQTDADGFQVLNASQIDEVLEKSQR